MALDHRSSIRSDNDCGTSCIAGYIEHRNKFRVIQVEKERYLLYQPSAVRRKLPILMLYLTIDSVNVGGKLDIMCFDKTGTLTEDGLDVLGIRVVNRPAMRYLQLLELFG